MLNTGEVIIFRVCCALYSEQTVQNCVSYIGRFKANTVSKHCSAGYRQLSTFTFPIPRLEFSKPPQSWNLNSGLPAVYFPCPSLSYLVSPIAHYASLHLPTAVLSVPEATDSSSVPPSHDTSSEVKPPWPLEAGWIPVSPSTPTAFSLEVGSGRQSYFIIMGSLKPSLDVVCSSVPMSHMSKLTQRNKEWDIIFQWFLFWICEEQEWMITGTKYYGTFRTDEQGSTAGSHFDNRITEYGFYRVTYFPSSSSICCRSLKMN